MYFNEDGALSSVRTPFNRKVLGRGPDGAPKVYVDFQARPFNELAPGDMLDTPDLCRLFRCSVRSVYRWVAEHSLQPAWKVGREFLFTKREVVRWYDANRPRPPGRPPIKRNRS